MIKINSKEMDFGSALNLLQQGHRIKRTNWGGYWSLENINGFSRPVIVATLKGTAERVPATAYQEDMLATNWVTLD